MKNLFTCLSKKSLSLENGSGMDREWIENGSVCSRKLFVSIFFLLLLSINYAWGETVTFDFNTSEGCTAMGITYPATLSTYTELTENSPYTISPISFTIKNSKASNKTKVYNASGNTDLRMYHKTTAPADSSKLTITGGSLPITQIVFTRVGKSNDIRFVASSGSIGDLSDDTYTWTGSATSVTFSTTATSYIKSFVVTYSEGTAYTVTFDAEGGSCDTDELTEEEPGDGVELPEATPNARCIAEGWEFAGWATASCSETTTEPTLYAAGSTYHPADDCTLHAVYKAIDEDECGTPQKITSGTTLTVDAKIVITYEGNDPKVQYNGIKSNYGDTVRYTTTPNYTHALVVKAGSSNGSYAFYEDGLGYLGHAGAATQLNTLTQIKDSSSWSISITNGNATIQNVQDDSRYLKYNNSDRFACYGTGSTYKTVQLYYICPDVYVYDSNPSCIKDHFIDVMHDNEVDDQTGTYSMPDLSDESAGSYCEGQHYKFIGWVAEDDIDEDGSLKTGYTLIVPGTEQTADNITFYAIWAEDLE